MTVIRACGWCGHLEASHGCDLGHCDVRDCQCPGFGYTLPCPEPNNPDCVCPLCELVVD